MSALVMALAFVACEKDDVKDPEIKLSETEIAVIIDGDAVEVEVTDGTAPYTATVAEGAEDATFKVTADVDAKKISIAAVTKEETPEPEAKEGEGDDTEEPVVVEVTVKDAKGKTATIKVTVTEAEEEGEDK